MGDMVSQGEETVRETQTRSWGPLDTLGAFVGMTALFAYYR